MRELTNIEVNSVEGGLRWLAGNVAWEVAKAVVTAVASEKHEGGDSCDYYSNMPAGAQ